MNSLSFEQSTVRHLLFHRQLQVVGCWGINVSFLCGSNSDFNSERRQSWLWCLHRFLNNIVYGHSLSKRWLCRIIDGCRVIGLTMSVFFSHFSFTPTLSTPYLSLCVFVCSVFSAPQWEFVYFVGKAKTCQRFTSHDQHCCEYVWG